MLHKSYHPGASQIVELMPLGEDEDSDIIFVLGDQVFCFAWAVCSTASYVYLHCVDKGMVVIINNPHITDFSYKLSDRLP